MDAIFAALVSGGLALVGVVITVNASQRKTEAAIKTDLAVMNNEVKNLSTEVEKHNSFATRIPALEAKEQANEDAIKRLENFHME